MTHDTVVLSWNERVVSAFPPKGLLRPAQLCSNPQQMKHKERNQSGHSVSAGDECQQDEEG